MKSHTLASLLVSLLLAACGSMSNRASVALISNEAFTSQKTGVVILSTGAPGLCISMSTFLKVFDAASRKLVASAPLIPVDPYTNKSEFASHHGLINAVELPPGEYYLSPWTANPYVTATKTPAFAFKVQPGETIYVGELFMPQSCGLSTVLVVRDQYERDIKLATEKNPLIAQRTVTKRLLLAVPQ